MIVRNLNFMSKLNYIKGDLFSHKSLASSILAHACNCRGSWGAGVDENIKKQFPSTYKLYVEHCKKHASNPSGLLGSTYLIKSESSDPGNSGRENVAYVACMFTSDAFGRRKNSADDIVENTDKSMLHLESQLAELAKTEPIEQQDGVNVVNMPKINAGLFNVPWEETEAVLKKHQVLINVYVI